MIAVPGRSAPRVCVTGGLGFIGSHLCALLSGRGYEVLCVDRAAARSGAPGLPDPARITGVQVARADVSSAPLAPLLDGACAVVHLAALPGVRAAHPLADLWRQNAHATARIAEALGSEQRLILASTSSVYGNAGLLPTPETWPVAPLNPYAVTKLHGERAALAAAAAGADVVVCRLFTVFGPGQRSDMAFSRWIDSIARDLPVTWCARQDARREFTYVEDAALGLVAALERGRSGEVYNLAGSGSWPVRSALREVERLLGRRARLAGRPAHSEAIATAACGRKALEDLGHAPAVTLREGLERQVEAAVPGSTGAARPASKPAVAARATAAA